MYIHTITKSRPSVSCVRTIPSGVTLTIELLSLDSLYRTSSIFAFNWMELRGANKMLSVVMCFGVSNSSILKTKWNKSKQQWSCWLKNKMPLMSFYLPTTSTNVDIFWPPGSCTVAWIFALPGFKALIRTEIKSVSEYSIPKSRKFELCNKILANILFYMLIEIFDMIMLSHSWPI